MRLDGHWYAPRSSARRRAVLELGEDGYRLRLDEAADGATDGAAISVEGRVDTLAFSDRLGETARRVRFADGALFETADNAAVDAWLAGSGHAGARTLGIHRLERSWPMIATGLLVSVALAIAAFRWGLPAVAERIAERLPVTAHERVGEGALATMDRFFLDDSELPPERRAALRERFDALVREVPDDGFELELHFRRLGALPNAFALPGGDIVVTDALVELVGAPEELDAVLLHEIGHVHERHGMRHAIQASAVTLVVALALGDVGGLGELATAVPVFLLQSSYSRRSESEADEFAFARMLESGRDPRHFAAIIRRLSDPTAWRQGGADEGADEGAAVRADWMSTHPDPERRARRALELSRELDAARR